MSMQADPLVRVEGVDKTYSNGTVALQGVNLAVAERSFVSLVGPSGCGKSTLLRIIAGLGQASTGRVSIAGRAPRQAAKEQSLGFVFQDANLLPWRPVIDNVALPLELAGVAKRKRHQAAEEVLELVGLQDFSRVYPKELSGGMRMRVSIARALITKPSLLLMDEPFGALDEITRQYLNQELLRLQEASQATVVFVTHNVFEAVFLSERIVVMSAQPGRIVLEVDVVSQGPRNEHFRGSEDFSQAVMKVVAALGNGAMGSGAQEMAA